MEPNNKKKILIVVGVVIVAIIAATLFVFLNKKEGSVVVTEVIEKTATTTEPIKKDFGLNMPTGFPEDIPLEKGVKVDQSYSLSYSEQDQLTIVFLSTKTVKENYSIYSDFLKQKGWSVLNSLETKSISSLYGTKDNNDINVTISDHSSPGGSQVSISILKK